MCDVPTTFIFEACFCYSLTQIAILIVFILLHIIFYDNIVNQREVFQALSLFLNSFLGI